MVIDKIHLIGKMPLCEDPLIDDGKHDENNWINAKISPDLKAAFRKTDGKKSDIRLSEITRLENSKMEIRKQDIRQTDGRDAKSKLDNANLNHTTKHSKGDYNSINTESKINNLNHNNKLTEQKMTDLTNQTDLMNSTQPDQTGLHPVIHHHRHNLKNRFELLKTLGQGTYGKVKLAMEYNSGKKVAIKYIRKNRIQDEHDLNRIRREIKIMASLHHPHIINVKEVFENKEKIVLVMEYAKGGELYEYINVRKRLEEKEARQIFRQIVSAVNYCHENGVVHRDLKLENIVLTEEGLVKIADFGLSNYFGPDHLLSTYCGSPLYASPEIIADFGLSNYFGPDHLLSTYCGSPLYASPEIVNGTPYLGPEVDCWSLGVVLYTLVYGAMPFDGTEFRVLKQQITTGTVYEPRNKSAAHMLIRCLLEPDPGLRGTIPLMIQHWWLNVGYTTTVTGEPCNMVTRRQKINVTDFTKRHSWSDCSHRKVLTIPDNFNVNDAQSYHKNDFKDVTDTQTYDYHKNDLKDVQLCDNQRDQSDVHNLNDIQSHDYQQIQHKHDLHDVEIKNLSDLSHVYENRRTSNGSEYENVDDSDFSSTLQDSDLSLVIPDSHFYQNYEESFQETPAMNYNNSCSVDEKLTNHNAKTQNVPNNMSNTLPESVYKNCQTNETLYPDHDPLFIRLNHISTNHDRQGSSDSGSGQSENGSINSESGSKSGCITSDDDRKVFDAMRRPKRSILKKNTNFCSSTDSDSGCLSEDVISLSSGLSSPKNSDGDVVYDLQDIEDVLTDSTESTDYCENLRITEEHDYANMQFGDVIDASGGLSDENRTPTSCFSDVFDSNTLKNNDKHTSYFTDVFNSCKSVNNNDHQSLWIGDILERQKHENFQHQSIFERQNHETIDRHSKSCGTITKHKSTNENTSLSDSVDSSTNEQSSSKSCDNITVPKIKGILKHRLTSDTSTDVEKLSQNHTSKLSANNKKSSENSTLTRNTEISAHTQSENSQEFSAKRISVCSQGSSSSENLDQSFERYDLSQFTMPKMNDVSQFSTGKQNGRTCYTDGQITPNVNLSLYSNIETVPSNNMNSQTSQNSQTSLFHHKNKSLLYSNEISMLLQTEKSSSPVLVKKITPLQNKQSSEPIPKQQFSLSQNYESVSKTPSHNHDYPQYVKLSTPLQIQELNQKSSPLRQTNTEKPQLLNVDHVMSSISGKKSILSQIRSKLLSTTGGFSPLTSNHRQMSSSENDLTKKYAVKRDFVPFDFNTMNSEFNEDSLMQSHRF